MHLEPVELEENFEKTQFDGVWRFSDAPIRRNIGIAPVYFSEVQEHGITPRQIRKARNLNVFAGTEAFAEGSSSPKPYADPETPSALHAADPVVAYMSPEQLQKSIDRTRKLMQEAAKKLDFIQAAQYRDELLKLEDLLKEKKTIKLFYFPK